MPWGVRLRGKRRRLTRKAPQPLSPGPTTLRAARWKPRCATCSIIWTIGSFLQIAYLRGALLPTRDEPPWFDDPQSFALAIDTAVVTISTASLSALLNNYTFNYDGSPLENLTVTVDKGQLKQTGTLHKGIPLPFTIRAELSTTPDGRLRLHPTSVKVAGIGVKGLMRTFGIELEGLVKVRPGRGVEIADNDFLLAPAGLLPPPRIEGRVIAVRIDGESIEQTFGGSTRPGRSRDLHPSDPSAPNYMYYRGKVLRFGKLTMMDMRRVASSSAEKGRASQ